MSKVIAMLLVGSLTCWHASLMGQISDSVSFAYSKWNSQQRKAVLLYMDLSEVEKISFCPVFDSYIRVMGLLEVKRLQLLDCYSRGFSELGEKQIAKLYAGLLKNDLHLARVRKQYYKRIRRALSPARANEFFYLDQSIRTWFRMEAKASTPFAFKIVTQTAER